MKCKEQGILITRFPLKFVPKDSSLSLKDLKENDLTLSNNRSFYSNALLMAYRSTRPDIISFLATKSSVFIHWVGDLMHITGIDLLTRMFSRGDFVIVCVSTIAAFVRKKANLIMF